jgi:hypothetical protein
MPKHNTLERGYKRKAHSRNKYNKTKRRTGKLRTGRERMQTVTFKSSSSQVRTHTNTDEYTQTAIYANTRKQCPVLNNAIVRQVTRIFNNAT